MSYRIAGIDVHKKMLAVVVSDVEGDGEYQFERVRYSSSPEHLRREDQYCDRLNLAWRSRRVVQRTILRLQQPAAEL